MWRCSCAQLGGVQSLPQLSHHLRQAGGNYGAEVAAAVAADEVAPPTTKHDPGTPPTVRHLPVAPKLTVSPLPIRVPTLLPRTAH